MAEIILINKSKVPIKFRIYCPDDGNEEALTCHDYVITKSAPMLNPKEFSFSIKNGIVLPVENLAVNVINSLINYLIKRESVQKTSPLYRHLQFLI